MPERPGPWELLDQPSDPVVADLPEVDSRLAYFQSLAETMRTEGQRLSQIASGESLKGKYADKLRSASGTVANDLNQVVGRYEAVVQALTTYEPALDAGLSGSAQALDDAIDANTALQAAAAMPTATAPAGGTLTPQQEQDNADKTAATDSATDALNAAKQKLAGVLSALDEAGQTATATIRKGFNDGLTDSAWDRFKYAFKKFLEILVKILTYIGMALAVLALIIPGVGELALAAGVALGAVTVAANIALKALGGGSWADLGIAIAGLLTFGAAKLLGPAIQTGLKSLAGAIRGVGSAGTDAVGDVGDAAANVGDGVGSSTATSAADDVVDDGSGAVSDVADETGDAGNAGDGPTIPEDIDQQIEWLPDEFERQGDSLTFAHPSAPGESFQFLGEDDYGVRQFTVSSTGENVNFDTDLNAFVKPDGSPAGFNSYTGPLPTTHFLVKGFEGQDLTRVDNLEDLASRSDGTTPVLVRTDQLPQVRTDINAARQASIEQGFKDGAPLRPVALHPSDLSLSDGNHRIAAARALGLPYVPVIVTE